MPRVPPENANRIHHRQTLAALLLQRLNDRVLQILIPHPPPPNPATFLKSVARDVPRKNLLAILWKISFPKRLPSEFYRRMRAGRSGGFGPPEARDDALIEQDRADQLA